MHPFNQSIKPDYDNTRFVYHYTKLETARDHILPSATLRFNQLANVNDPKESISNDWLLFGSADDLGNARERVVEFFRLNVKAACFSRDNPDICSHDEYGIDACSRGYMKPRMWATYGDEHKGVCLVFDKQKLEAVFRSHIEPDDRFFHGDVRYGRFLTPEDSLGFSINFAELDKDFISTIHRMVDEYSGVYFFFKHADWMTEDEYRCILVGNRQQIEHLPFGDALVGVALGVDTPEKEIDKIVALADDKKVPVIQSTWGFTHGGTKCLNDIATAVTAE